MKVYVLKYDELNSLTALYIPRTKYYTDVAEFIARAEIAAADPYCMNIEVFAGELKSLDLNKVRNPL